MRACDGVHTRRQTIGTVHWPQPSATHLVKGRRTPPLGTARLAAYTQAGLTAVMVGKPMSGFNHSSQRKGQLVLVTDGRSWFSDICVTHDRRGHVKTVILNSGWIAVSLLNKAGSGPESTNSVLKLQGPSIRVSSTNDRVSKILVTGQCQPCRHRGLIHSQ